MSYSRSEPYHLLHGAQRSYLVHLASQRRLSEVFWREPAKDEPDRKVLGGVSDIRPKLTGESGTSLPAPPKSQPEPKSQPILTGEFGRNLPKAA